jgi:hypothetical protein
LDPRFFNHHAAYAAVKISIERSDDDKVITGTGFFYLAKIGLTEEDTRSKLLLISNKHVLREGKGKMTLTLNRKGADGKPDYGAVRTFVYDGFEDRYIGHPDENVDLACVDISGITRSDADIRYIGEEFLTSIDYDRVALGSDVLFIGYPNDFYDTVNNLPLVRKGTLASMPNIDFMGKGTIVVDAQVFEGSSGSPVFVDWGGKYRLLGVISGTTEGKTPSGVPAVLGLGIVVKQRHVQELIDHSVNQVKRKIASGGTLLTRRSVDVR